MRQKAMLQHGIECARRTRNQHALAEMEAMLDELVAGDYYPPFRRDQAE